MYRRARPTPAARWADRMFWVGLRRFWPDWTSALVVARRATVINWHGAASPGSGPDGRVTSADARGSIEIRRLVREMADANRLWGAPRIHGELLKLGFNVSERTVSRLMPRRRRPPSQTWRTFLQNHVGAIVAIDFFTVPTLTCRLLFVFVVLAHDRRRIINATANPTSAWTRQQLREAFPWEATAPRVPRSRHRRQRAPPAQTDAFLRRLLPSVTDAPRARKGPARSPAGRDARNGSRRGTPESRRAASSLRTPRRLAGFRRPAGRSGLAPIQKVCPKFVDLTPDSVQRRSRVTYSARDETSCPQIWDST